MSESNPCDILQCFVGKINSLRQSGFCDLTFNQCFVKHWSLSIFQNKNIPTLEAYTALKINLNSLKDLNVALKSALSEKNHTHKHINTHLAA